MQFKWAWNDVISIQLQIAVGIIGAVLINLVFTSLLAIP